MGTAALIVGAMAWAALVAPAHAVAVPVAAPSAGQPAPLADSKRWPASRVAQGPATAPRQTVHTRPVWAELTGDQQQALSPLATTWNVLSEAQKRKWLALSLNFRKMSAQEQATLHSRMNDWVALSPRQRSQARLNFGESKSVSAGDKKAMWEAYQALSPEEKRKLAARANAPTSPTAAAVRPVPRQKLANVPPGTRDAKSPRIAAGPDPDRTSVPASGLAPLAPQSN